MAIDKQPKSKEPIDTNQLVNNILRKVSHIVSLRRDIPRKELIELRDMYLQFKHADKLAIVEVLPDTIEKLYKSVNLVSPMIEKQGKTRINLNELAEGNQKGVEEVSQGKVDDEELKKIESAIDYNIGESVKNINAILDVDAEATKAQQEVGSTGKINKNLAEITNLFLQKTVKIWIGIESPETEFTKEDVGIPEYQGREEKNEVLADSRQEPEEQLEGVEILKPDKEPFPIGSFPDFTFKSSQDLDTDIEKENKILQSVSSDIEHDEKEIVATQSTLEHDEKEETNAEGETARIEKTETDTSIPSVSDDKEITDVSPEVYDVEKAKRWETEEDIDYDAVTDTEKELSQINADSISENSRDLVNNPGLKDEKDISNLPEAEEPVPFISKKYRQVGWMEGLTSFFNARVLNQGDPRTINYQLPQNREMTNMVTGITAQANPFGLGLNIDTGGIGRFLAGAATIFPPFSGTTTAEIAKAIITIQRKINTQVNAFELAVAWELVYAYRFRGAGGPTIDGGRKTSDADPTHPPGVVTTIIGGTREEFILMEDYFSQLATRRKDEEHRKLKPGDAGFDTEGEQRMTFDSHVGGDKDGNKNIIEGEEPFVIVKDHREHPSHRFYNREQYLLRELSKHCTGFIKVYLRRGPKWEGEKSETDKDFIKYIPFQFEPEISGDGKRASYSQLQTLARSQAAYAYRNSEARGLSMTIPYLITSLTEQQRNESSLISVGRSGPGGERGTPITKSGGQELIGWDENFIYNYIIRWYRQIVLPNFPEGTNFRLAPPLMQIWYGGLVPADSHLKVSSTGSITNNTNNSAEFLDDSGNELMNDVPPMFRTNWYYSGNTYRTYRSLWIATGVSFDYKHGFVNARTKNRLGVDVKLELVEVGPGVTENEVVRWRDYAGA
jgi:hypothetical protein